MCEVRAVELKKSYKGFVLWMLGFLALVFAAAFVPSEDEMLPMRLITLVMCWGVASMAFLIWKTEAVYWYNGTSYEDAVAAGQERRKEFAWRHLVIFLRFALMMTAASCVTLLLGWSAWIDFAFGTVGLVVACFMTVSLKL